MNDEKKKLLENLARSVLEMDEDLAVESAHRVLGIHMDPKEAISGLAKGMEAAGEKYENEEYFIPELLLCSDAMYAGVDVLNPHIARDTRSRGTAVIGVVAGDTHDIGKNLVKLFMEAAGFKVIDLGRDVPVDCFIETVKKQDVQFLCMSTLMTTTMAVMEQVIRRLEEENIREKVSVIIGGAPISRSFADKIGADAYSAYATDAPDTAGKLLVSREDTSCIRS